MKINKEELIIKYKTLLKKILIFFKTIYNLHHSGKYFITSIVLFIIFIFITFPYDSLIRKRLFSLEKKIYKSINFSKLDFSIFGDTYCENLSIEMNNNNEVSCKNIILNIAFNPVTFLIQDKLKGDFQFDLLKFSTRDYQHSLNVNGRMNVVIDEKTRYPVDGFIKMVISDSIIRLYNVSIPGPMGAMNLKIDSVNIQSGNIDTVFTRGNCRINTFKLTGNDISCNVTGTMDFTATSKLDLTISIDSESTVLDQYRDILGSFIKNNVLMLRLKGTFAKPELTLFNQGKDEN
jgi:hypothetical protein